MVLGSDIDFWLFAGFENFDCRRMVITECRSDDGTTETSDVEKVGRGQIFTLTFRSMPIKRGSGYLFASSFLEPGLLELRTHFRLQAAEAVLFPVDEFAAVSE